MTSVRAAKAKGSAFEYTCQHSLQLLFDSSVTRTSERGYQMQYDLRIDLAGGNYIAIECKRLKGISWNQLVKFYEKLEKVAKDASSKYLLFQSNHQPCLVFHKENNKYLIKTFEDYFGVPFEKHPSTRVKKK